MDFVHRMMNRNCQDFSEDIPSLNQTPVMMEVNAMDPLVMKWRRLVMSMGVAMNHALTGSIFTFLEQMRCQHATEALNEYNRVAGTAAQKNLKAVKSSPVSALTPMAKGKALPPSKSIKGKPYPEDPSTCLHPDEKMSKPRGGPGGSAWMTCLGCGNRWERTMHPALLCLHQEKPGGTTLETFMGSSPKNPVTLRIPNPQILNPEQVLQEKKELALEALIKDVNSAEFKQLKEVFLNYQASGMLTPLECVEQMIRGCATEMEMVAVNAFARIHVKNFE